MHHNWLFCCISEDSRPASFKSFSGLTLSDFTICSKPCCTDWNNWELGVLLLSTTQSKAKWRYSFYCHDTNEKHNLSFFLIMFFPTTSLPQADFYSRSTNVILHKINSNAKDLILLLLLPVESLKGFLRCFFLLLFTRLFESGWVNVNITVCTVRFIGTANPQWENICIMQLSKHRDKHIHPFICMLIFWKYIISSRVQPLIGSWIKDNSVVKLGAEHIWKARSVKALSLTGRFGVKSYLCFVCFLGKQELQRKSLAGSVM